MRARAATMSVQIPGMKSNKLQSLPNRTNRYATVMSAASLAGGNGKGMIEMFDEAMLHTKTFTPSEPIHQAMAFANNKS